jgi:hypothetical protein
MTPLTPFQIRADIAALDRIEHDWLIEGRLDCITEQDIADKRAELREELARAEDEAEVFGRFGYQPEKYGRM